MQFILKTNAQLATLVMYEEETTRARQNLEPCSVELPYCPREKSSASIFKIDVA